MFFVGTKFTDLSMRRRRRGGKLDEQ